MLGVDGAVRTEQPVQPFFRNQERDAEPGLLLRIFLQDVVAAGIPFPALEPFAAVAPVRLGDFFPVNAHQVLIDLIQFFFQRHLGDQRGNFLGKGMAVGFHSISSFLFCRFDGLIVCII